MTHQLAALKQVLQAFKPDPVGPLVWMDEVTEMRDADWDKLYGSIQLRSDPAVPEGRVVIISSDGRKWVGGWDPAQVVEVHPPTSQ